MPETKEKRQQKPRDVDYTLEVVEDLPDIEIIRRSPLNDQIEKILAKDAAGENDRSKFSRISSYANGSAASAAANVLRQKLGDKPAVGGFLVATKRYDTDDGKPRTGVFVKYDPSLIVPGEHELFVKRMEERNRKNQERAAQRKAAAATVTAVDSASDEAAERPRNKKTA